MTVTIAQIRAAAARCGPAARLAVKAIVAVLLEDLAKPGG